jgi:hypothetical protein
LEKLFFYLGLECPDDDEDDGDGERCGRQRERDAAEDEGSA